MEPNEIYSGGGSDLSPAVPLEISADLAARVDAILQDFAEGAELETALVVERSGALVSGISSEVEVIVDVISALVAGASAAMNALVRELGSTGEIESFHQSKERAVYLAEIMDGFVLVGVSTVPVPVGVIREKAHRIRPALIDLLRMVKVPAPSLSGGAQPRKFSLRDAALLKHPGLLPSAGTGLAATPDTESVPEAETEMPVFYGDDELSEGEAGEGITRAEEAGDGIFEVINDEEEEHFIPDPAGPDPTEVIEFLGDEGPGIVIEDASGAVIDSPFEAEDDYREDAIAPDGGGDSIFELEDDEEEEEEMPLPAVPAIELLPEEFEADREETFVSEAVGEIQEEAEVVFELAEEDSAFPSAETFPFFEIDEEEAAEAAFELDFDDFDDDDDASSRKFESGIEETEKIEETEVSSSGPFYF